MTGPSPGRRTRPAIRRFVVVAALVAVIAAVAAVVLKPSPLPVDVVAAVRGPMQVTLDEEGETRVRDRFVVSAPLAGRVLRIDLEPGDAVIASRTVMATFRPTSPVLLDVRTRAELQARVAAAEAAVNRTRAEQQRTEAQLAQAERDVQRMRELTKFGAIAAGELEASELAVTTARNATDAARASVSAADADLRASRASLMAPAATDQGSSSGPTIVLRAPIDGVVLRRLRESEAVVPQGEPLLEVGDLSKLEIVADFLSTDAVRIRAGQETLIERWGGGEAITGRVRRVEPSGFTKISALGVEEQRVNVVIDFDRPGEAFGQLGDRYRVEVRVVVWKAADVVTVPISSLLRTAGRWTVFVVGDKHAVLTPVEVGERNDTAAQIVKGLSPGTLVVTFPSDDLSDGALVEPRATEATATQP